MSDSENSSMFTLDQAWSLFQAAKKEKYQAIVAEGRALEMLAIAAGSKTFYYGDKLYQVRVRKNKEVGQALGWDDPEGYPVAFICELKKPVKKRFEKRQSPLPPAHEPAPAVAEELRVPDVDYTREVPSLEEQLKPQVEAHRREEEMRPKKISGTIDDDALFGARKTEEGIVELD